MPSRVFILMLFTWLIFCFEAKAQAEKILAIKDKRLRLQTFCNWAHENIYSATDSSVSKRQTNLDFLNDVYKKASDSGDEDLKSMAWFTIELWKVGGVINSLEPQEQSAKKLLKAADNAKGMGWRQAEAQCRMAAASIYFRISYFDPAFNEGRKAFKIIQTFNPNEFVCLGTSIADYAGFYFHFMEYDSTIRIIKTAFDISPRCINMTSYTKALNILGLSFYALNKKDSAVFYYRRAYENAKLNDDESWKEKTGGNLGQVYFEMGHDTLALPLLEQSFTINIKNHHIADALKNAGLLFTLYLENGDSENAVKNLSFLRLNFDSLTPGGRAKYYRYLADLAISRKNLKAAIRYIDTSQQLELISRRVRDKEIQQRSKDRVAMSVYLSRIKTLESKQIKDRSLRNGLIGIIPLVLIIVLLYRNRIQMKRNAAVRVATIEKKVVEDELIRARAELNKFAQLLVEKNDLIEKFRSSIQKNEFLVSEHERVAVLTQLTATNILSETDWKKFKILFDKVYPDFFERLKQLAPALSVTDLQLLALTKLHVAQKDMAVMLGMGYDALRKSRQRLRDKIYPGKDETLESLVKEL